jgi:hypothetical protein
LRSRHKKRRKTFQSAYSNGRSTLSLPMEGIEMTNSCGLVNVWRLITHHKRPEDFLQMAKNEGRLAVGWSDIGDITQHGYDTPEKIARAIKREMPDNPSAHLGGPSLWRFSYKVKIKDLVILSTGKRRDCVMKVTGEYFYAEMREGRLSEDYQHQRTAQVVPKDADELWEKAGGLAVGETIRWTFVECLRPVDASDC